VLRRQRRLRATDDQETASSGNKCPRTKPIPLSFYPTQRVLWSFANESDCTRKYERTVEPWLIYFYCPIDIAVAEYSSNWEYLVRFHRTFLGWRPVSVPRLFETWCCVWCRFASMRILFKIVSLLSWGTAAMVRNKTTHFAQLAVYCNTVDWYYLTPLEMCIWNEAINYLLILVLYYLGP
jgi:hypothetical protein